MIVVNGVAGSGFESILNTFKNVAGVRHTASIAYDGRDKLKASAGPSSEYEKYLDKFSPFSREDVVSALEAMAPDGVWPIYNAYVDSARDLFAGTMKPEVTVRMGGSLFNLKAEEVDKIYIVTASPRTVWARRNALRAQLRALDLKFGADRCYKQAVQLEFREWQLVPQTVTEEYALFKDYINNCLFMFPDKVEFVDGEGDSLVFRTPNCEVQVPNGNIHKHPMAGKVPEGAILQPFNKLDFEKVKTLWEDTKNLISKRNVQPMISKEQTPGNWFCSRLQINVNLSTCLQCAASQGEFVIADAKPGWDQEPCAYEVAYGPAPHKTVVQSINEHNWGTLP